MTVKRIESDFLASNTFVVENDNECLIVDAGVNPDKLKKLLKKKVVGVLLTHGHYDHVYFSESYQKIFNCPIFISKEGLNVACDKKVNYGDDFFVKNPDIFSTFDKDCEINIGKFKIKIVFTPGHSEGSVCYLIDKNLFTGDTLFKQGIGRCDLYGGSEKKMLASLNKINEIDFETLYSGHGQESTKLEQKRNITVFIKFLERKI